MADLDAVVLPAQLGPDAGGLIHQNQSDDSWARRVEQVTRLPFAVELAVA